MHSHTSSDVDHSLANEFMTAQSERVTEHELAAAAHIIINVKRAERSSQWSQSVMRMLHVGSGLLGLLTFRIPSLNFMTRRNAERDVQTWSLAVKNLIMITVRGNRYCHTLRATDVTNCLDNMYTSLCAQTGQFIS
ncbi:hypothetical protein AB1N83_013342, partial [Pleurotus pulmonarius]